MIIWAEGDSLLRLFCFYENIQTKRGA